MNPSMSRDVRLRIEKPNRSILYYLEDYETFRELCDLNVYIYISIQIILE